MERGKNKDAEWSICTLESFAVTANSAYNSGVAGPTPPWLILILPFSYQTLLLFNILLETFSLLGQFPERKIISQI